MTSTSIVGYLALFSGLGFLFLFGNLLVGRFLRPNSPNAEKLSVYECGEPTIGSSFVQFDLRFYTVALLFLIFDVEVALFFPWGMVFGKSLQLADSRMHQASSFSGDALLQQQTAAGLQNEMGISPQGAGQSSAVLQQAARDLAAFSFYDILVFFAVLMTGFFYVWKRGDLDWVRALAKERALQGSETERAPAEEEPVLAG